MIPKRILLGPGPSDVSSEVLAALAQPTIGHLDPVFIEIMDRLRANLRLLFRTENELTLPVSGTGSAGMETLFVNLVEPGDRVLVGVNGIFGGRMMDVASRAGATVFKVETDWGKPLDRDLLLEAAKKHDVNLVAVVHAETSTGCAQPLEGLGAELHKDGRLLLVDCVTSLSGMPVEIDKWEIDAAYSGSQKCLSCPPGLSPITLSSRAAARMDSRKTKVQSWYLDLSLVKNYWGSERTYHHTAPVNMLYALDKAVQIAIDEGLEARFQRHRDRHKELRAGLEELGCAYLSEEGAHLPMLNAVSLPAPDEASIRSKLLRDYSIEVGGGLGAFKGKAWRIGLMGHAASQENVSRLLDALSALLASK